VHVLFVVPTKARALRRATRLWRHRALRLQRQVDLLLPVLLRAQCRVSRSPQAGRQSALHERRRAVQLMRALSDSVSSAFWIWLFL
jgi:hypothetical protein